MIEWLVNKKLFRNANHAIWFLTSFGFLIFTIVYYVLPGSLWLLIVIPLVIHIPSLATSIKVKIKRQDSEIYSADCIWFNAIMIGAYIIVWFLIR